MKTILLIMLCLLAVTAAGLGQTNEALATQLKDIDRQLMDLRRQAMRSDEGKALHESARKAGEDYRNAVANIPEIKAIDARTTELRKEMMELHEQRRGIEKAKAGDLADLISARDAAEQKLRNALSGGEEGRKLEEQRQALMKQMINGQR